MLVSSISNISNIKESSSNYQGIHIMGWSKTIFITKL